MAGELNIEVHDKPDECRATANYLRSLAEAADEACGLFKRGQTESESLWVGQAGMEFRASQTPNVQDSSEVAGMAGTFAKALDAFAGDIDTVRARLQQARQVAHEAELITTRTAILPPGPGPSAVPPTASGSDSPNASPQRQATDQAHEQQVADHQRKQRAFQEVTGTVSDARKFQAEAHGRLTAATIDPLATLKATKTWGVFVVGHGLSYIKATQTTANDLMEKARRLDVKVEQYKSMAWATEDPLLKSQYGAMAEGFQREALTSQQAAETVKRPINGVPESVRQGIESNPGNGIKGGQTGWLRLGKGAARGVPVIGTGLTVASGATDVAMGKPVGQAAGETGGSLAGGVVGGVAGAESGAIIGGAIGTVVPVAGNAAGAAIGGVVGGVAGGMIGSLSGTQAADAAMGVEQ